VEALSKMRRDGASRLMVVEGETLRGLLTLKDLLRFLSLKLELEEDMPPRLAAGLRTAAPRA
jgi:CBS domain-containing protein